MQFIYYYNMVRYIEVEALSACQIIVFVMQKYYLQSVSESVVHCLNDVLLRH